MGEQVAGLVLALADSFKGTAVPGYVVLVQFGFLLFSLAAVTWVLRRKLSYIKILIYMLKGVDGPLTSGRLAELNPFLLRPTKNVIESRQKRTWASFCGSLEEVDGPGQQLSALIPPSEVLTRDSMQVGRGIWRHVPGLFVSTGLVLTFLGLIAALRESGHTILLAGEDPELLKDSLSNLLRIASAKFIMSLMGLLASIILGFYLNWLDARTNAMLAELASVIENRVKLASPEKTLNSILQLLNDFASRQNAPVPLVTFLPDEKGSAG